LPVFVLTGRFGPYVQLGEMEAGSKVKPPRSSLFKTMTPESVTLDEALQLLSLPRVVGADAEGVEITAQNGKFGPYLKKGTDSRSLESEDQLFTVTPAQAEAIFAEPKRRGRGAAKPPLAEFAESPDTGKVIRILDGRFGPYITDGETNVTVPRGSDPAEVTFDDALAMLRAKAAAGPSKKRKAPVKKKAPAKKKAATKKKAPAKKKAAAKKAPAKKAPSLTTGAVIASASLPTDLAGESANDDA
jgi:DNA topoisomerase-1